MINLLLVDDEPIVRIGFKTVLDWHELGINNLREASNGKEALEIFKKGNTDVVITDIKMPVMDGIELISSIKSIDPNTLIIVLSSHDDYEYVKKTFKMGIHDYILKSDINKKNMIKLFKEINEKTKENNSKKNIVIDDENAENLRKAKLLTDIINSENPLTPEQICSKMQQIGWNPKTKYTALSVISIYKFNEVKKKYFNDDTSKLYFSINHMIQETENKFGNFLNARIKENEIALVFSSFKGESLENFRKKIAEICYDIMLHAKRFANLNTFFGVSNISSQGYSDIYELYNSAKCAQKYYFTQGVCKIIWYYQIEKNEIKDKTEEINSYVWNFKKMLSGRNYQDSEEILKKVLVNKSDLCGMSIEAVKKIYSIYSSLLFEYMGLNSVAYELEGKIKKFIYLVNCNASLNDLNNELKTILLYMNTFEELVKNPLVDKVKKYADSNYSSQITSRDAADSLNITQEHLCRIFSSDIGMSFTKYITNMRIEKAKELLLLGNKTIKQIGSMVGYTNNYYFCKVFKKVTGLSPSDFAKEHMKII